MRAKRIAVVVAAWTLVSGASRVAGAKPAAFNACYDVGFACFNAGSQADQAGECIASTCTDVLDASYPCGECELADAAVADASVGDAGTPEAAGIDATAGEAGGADSSTEVEDANAPGPDGASTDGASSSSGGDSGPGDDAPSSHTGDGSNAALAAEEPTEAGAGSAPPMPGCSMSPSGLAHPAGGIAIAVAFAAARMRRERRRGARTS